MRSGPVAFRICDLRYDFGPTGKSLIHGVVAVAVHLVAGTGDPAASLRGRPRGSMAFQFSIVQDLKRLRQYSQSEDVWRMAQMIPDLNHLSKRKKAQETLFPAPLDGKYK